MCLRLQPSLMGDVFPSPGFKELMDHGLVKSSNSLQTFFWCGPNNPNISKYTLQFALYDLLFLKIHLPNSSICFVDSACFWSTPMLFDMAKQLTPESPSMSHLHTMSTTQHKHILGTTRSRKGEHWRPSRRDPATGSIPPWIPVLWGPGLPMSMMSMLVAGKKQNNCVLMVKHGETNTSSSSSSSFTA